jgi:putative ABC transport system permease protein
MSYAIRSLARTPSFTVPAILTLALGIGGAACVGTVANGVLLKPLPYAEPNRLVGVWLQFPRLAGTMSVPQSDATYFVLRTYARSLEGIGAYVTGDANVDDGSEPERLTTARMTASAFDVLGVDPLLGRRIRESDDRPGQPPVVLLGEALWRRKFASDPAVLGRVIKIDGTAHEVIGVMPARFAFPNRSVQLWRPLQLDPLAVAVGNTSYTTIARLRPGMTIENAQRDVDLALRRTSEVYPNVGFGLSTQRLFEQTGARARLHALRDDVIGDVGQILWILVATAGVVLLIACANVANLFLVRAEAKQRDMAVRVALGGGPSVILGRFIGEGLVLASASVALGLIVALAGVRTLVRSGAFDIPRIDEIRVDGVTLAGMATLTVLVAVVCSVLPMLQFRPRQLIGALKSGGRGATTTRERQRVRQLLVVAQVAFAFVLLAGSALLGRSFRALRAIYPGFDPSNVLALSTALPRANYGPDDAVRFYDRAIDHLGRLPGVRHVAACWRLPLTALGPVAGSFYVEGVTSPLGERVTVSVVAGDYFAVMGIPMLAGTAFARVQPGEAPTEAIVSSQFARHVWGDSTGRTAIGRRIRPTPTSEWYTVVGVVGGVRGTSLMLPPDEMVYVPMTSPFLVMANSYMKAALADMPPYAMSFVLRSATDPVTLAQQARRSIAAMDPSLPVYSLRPMRDIVASSMARITLTALLLGIAAAIALTLGVIGIYGVVAYTASLRIQEIGLRLALGARPSDVIRLMARQGATLAGLGLGVGLVITLWVTRFLRAFLGDVSPTDPVTLGGTAFVLAAIAVLAAWLPARRAGRVEPSEVLAGE